MPGYKFNQSLPVFAEVNEVNLSRRHHFRKFHKIYCTHVAWWILSLKGNVTSATLSLWGTISENKFHTLFCTLTVQYNGEIFFSNFCKLLTAQTIERLKNMLIWVFVNPLKNWDKDMTPIRFSWQKVHTTHLFIITEWENKM